MASLDALSLTILLGAVLVLAGIMSSLVALRFGAPLLLVFLVIGMLAGEAGPGGIRFDDVPTRSGRSRSPSSCSTAACAPGSQRSAACWRRRACSPPSACC